MPALGAQQDLGKAAKAAGVKLFVPSEFGVPKEDATEGGFGQKNAVLRRLKDIGLPYTIFHTGPMPDMLFLPYVLIASSLHFD